LSVSITYRRAEIEDVGRIAGLPQLGEAGGDPEDRMRRYLAGEHHPHQALPPREMWMAEIARVPIGYAAGHLTRRFDCDGELQWIYVVREHRRSHIAHQLLAHIAHWFVHQQALRICVDVGDDAARPFYRQTGAIDLNKHWMVWPDISVVLSTQASEG
jgi:GNAT superfamily N-acetyltransferase